jgi:hypothetical protein
MLFQANAFFAVVFGSLLKVSQCDITNAWYTVD